MLIRESFKGPDRLYDALSSGRWIVLVARNSASGGAKARGDVADEVVKAADGLRNSVGIDILDQLPTRDAIIAGLKRAKPIKSKTPDGVGFTNTYLTIMLPEVKVILFVSTGSGRKLDNQFEQPFITELTTLVKTHKPALVFANRMDRLFRRMLTAAPLLNVLLGLNGLLGDSVKGVRNADEMMQFLILLEAYSAETEADHIPRKTRGGMISKTDLVMKNGVIKYAVQNLTPPGTIRMTLKNDRGLRGSVMLYLDDPKYFPKEDEVATGFPTQVSIGKKSNIELIQWVLSNLGKPGIDRVVVNAFLIKNNFSSPGFRHLYGSNAFHQPGVGPSNGDKPLRAIITNLDFYETGVNTKYNCRECNIVIYLFR
jgi:hypothetical protein